MHAEIAAAVAREQTPGLSAAAATRIEELLGRTATVIELEVGAALLRGGVVDSTACPRPRIELGPGRFAALAAARGPGAVIEAAVDLLAGGAVPTAVALLASASAAQSPGLAAAQADAAALGLTLASTGAVDEGPISVLGVGLQSEDAASPQGPTAGDVIVYLGGPTGRGLAMAPPAALPTPENQPLGDDLRALLRALFQRPGLLRAARLLAAGGLAQAAANLAVGSQLELDRVPRQPISMRPTEILLAEAPPRALVVVPAERVDEVLATAQAQAVGAVAVGVITGDRRLRALMKAPGSSAPRLVCELPLVALRGEAASTEYPKELPPPGAEEPPANGLAERLRAQLARPNLAGSAVVCRVGDASLVLALRCLSSPTLASARAAVSAVLGTVRASGARPAGTVCLVGAGPGAWPLVGLIESGMALGAAAHSTPSAWARSPGLSGHGWAVAVADWPADTPLLPDRFPGPGLLLAVLGFEDSEPAHAEATDGVCSELIASGQCAAALWISEGGLLLALGRACADGHVGCTAVLAGPQAVTAGGHRYLLAIPADRQSDARLLAAERAVPLSPLGRTGGRELLVRYSDGPPESPFREALRLELAQLAAPQPTAP